MEEDLVDAEYELRRLNDNAVIQPHEVRLLPRRLGSGSFCEVHAGLWSNMQVAVKHIDKALYEDLPEVVNIHWHRLARDLALSQRLVHPSVVTTYGILWICDPRMQIVMERCEGNLHETIDAAHRSGRYLSLREMVDLAADFLEGLRYLHSTRPTPFLHGGVESTNVCITSQMRGKLTGLSVTNLLAQTHFDCHLSSVYAAPEIVSGTIRNTVQAEMYSCGVTLTELFTGERARESSQNDHISMIRQQRLRLLCHESTASNPVRRPPARHAVEILREIQVSEDYQRYPEKRRVRRDGYHLTLIEPQSPAPASAEVMERLSSDLTKKNSELDHLRREVTAKSSEIEQLQHDVEICRSTLATKDAEIAQQQRQAHELSSQVAELEQNCSSCFQELDRVRSENEQLRIRLQSQGTQRQTQENTSLLRQSRRTEAEKEELRRRLRQFESSIEITDADVVVSNIVLGTGSYGGVRVGHWRDVDVAVKIFHESLLSDHNIQLYRQEVSVCIQTRHPNVVSMYGVVMTPQAPKKLVMELLAGSLKDVIDAANAVAGYLTLREQVDLANDSVTGITYLHKLPIVHGDIRSTNILVTGWMTAKIGDLGAAHAVQASLSVGPVSPEYLAPERQPGRSGRSVVAHNTPIADTFSMGVTILELFSGKMPDIKKRQQHLDSVQNEQLRRMCWQMMQVNETRRLPVDRAIAALLTVRGRNEYSECHQRRNVQRKLKGNKADGVHLIDLSKSDEIAQLQQEARAKDVRIQQITQEKRKILEQLGVSRGEKATLEERSTRLTAANERLTRQVESQQAVVRQGGNADTRRFLRENRRLDEENRENRAKLREYEDSLNINDADITKTDVFLGAGSFGDVWVAEWRGCQVAVKIFKDVQVSTFNERNVKEEVANCSRVHHPNVVSICGIITESSRPVQLVMELLPGSVSDVLHAAHVRGTGYTLTLREQIDIAMATLSGIVYLHTLQPRCLLHGDIRPTNVMVTELMVAKIADLGAARFADSSFTLGFVPSENYQAPERIGGASGSRARHSKAADVYSVGITLMEIFTGEQLPRSSRMRHLNAVPRMDLQDLIDQMIDQTPSARPPAEEALVTVRTVCGTPEYVECGPRRLVQSKYQPWNEGRKRVGVTLVDRPQADSHTR